jgi:hypothetical protein
MGEFNFSDHWEQVYDVFFNALCTLRKPLPRVANHGEG